jgi:hypothetical protein
MSDPAYGPESGRPDLVAVANEVHLVWAQRFIYHAGSADGGRHFNVQQIGNGREPRVAVTTSPARRRGIIAHVFVVWRDLDRLLLRRTADDGLSFDETVVINAHDGGLGEPQLLVVP